MLSFLVSPTPRTKTVIQNPIVFEGGRSELYFYGKDESSEFVMRATTPPQPSQAELNAGASMDNTLINPPHHFHLFQDETFAVRKGTIQVLLDGRRSTAEAGERVVIPAGVYHWFSNASATDDLVVDVGLRGAPGDTRDRDERFFRNLYSYLEDCNRCGGEECVKKGGVATGGPSTAPNPLQMMMFLESADVAVALPGVPKWLGMPLGRGIVTVLSFVGRWFLGFKTSYREYY